MRHDTHAVLDSDDIRHAVTAHSGADYNTVKMVWRHLLELAAIPGFNGLGMPVARGAEALYKKFSRFGGSQGAVLEFCKLVERRTGIFTSGQED